MSRIDKIIVNLDCDAVYCEKVLEVVKNEEAFCKCIQKCIEIYERSVDKWVKQFGKEYIRAVKGNPNFTTFMFAVMRGGNLKTLQFKEEQTIRRVGRVMFVKDDVRGFKYGFITADPNNVFFHQDDNPGLDFGSIEGKIVTYELGHNQRNGREKAINVHLKSFK